RRAAPLTVAVRQAQRNNAPFSRSPRNGLLHTPSVITIASSPSLIAAERSIVSALFGGGLQILFETQLL
ncbi:hypothetical protein Z043_111277, partial [Scleropages formosus]